MESNIAGMLGTGSLLKEGKGAREWLTEPRPSFARESWPRPFEYWVKQKKVVVWQKVAFLVTT